MPLGISPQLIAERTPRLRRAPTFGPGRGPHDIASKCKCPARWQAKAGLHRAGPSTIRDTYASQAPGLRGQKPEILPGPKNQPPRIIRDKRYSVFVLRSSGYNAGRQMV